MFHKIWHPDENDLIKFKILFIVSIPICILLPLVFNILIPSFAWHLISLLWLIAITSIRIISAIRFQIQAAAVVKTKRNKLFGKLSEKNRKQFLMNAFLKIPIVFTICITGILFVFNIIKPLNIVFVAILVLLCVAVYLYSIWDIYNKLAQDKEVI